MSILTTSIVVRGDQVMFCSLLVTSALNCVGGVQLFAVQYIS